MSVMNQTGEPINVFICHRAGGTLSKEIDDNEECKVLGPGEVIARKRLRTVDEIVMVYMLDYNTDTWLYLCHLITVGGPSNCDVD